MHQNEYIEQEQHCLHTKTTSKMPTKYHWGSSRKKHEIKGKHTHASNYC